MLARPLGPAACSWMKLEPAASCTASAGVTCQLLQSVVKGNTTSAAATPLIISLASRVLVAAPPNA